MCLCTQPCVPAEKYVQPKLHSCGAGLTASSESDAHWRERNAELVQGQLCSLHAVRQPLNSCSAAVQLSRQRVDLEHARGRERNAELVALQNESVAKQEVERQRVSAQIEAERRATEQHKVWLWGGVAYG